MVDKNQYRVQKQSIQNNKHKVVKFIFSKEKVTGINKPILWINNKKIDKLQDMYEFYQKYNQLLKTKGIPFKRINQLKNQQFRCNQRKL